MAASISVEESQNAYCQVKEAGVRPEKLHNNNFMQEGQHYRNKIDQCLCSVGMRVIPNGNMREFGGNGTVFCLGWWF